MSDRQIAEGPLGFGIRFGGARKLPRGLAVALLIERIAARFHRGDKYAGKRSSENERAIGLLLVRGTKTKISRARNGAVRRFGWRRIVRLCPGKSREHFATQAFLLFEVIFLALDCFSDGFGFSQIRR